MLIKAALTGDNHHNNPGRIEEAHRVHEWMLEDFKRRGAHFIGFAGDWNEVPPNERDQAWSRDFLGRCADVAPVAIIYGNHCPAGSLDEFHLQSEFKYPITVVTQPDVIVVDTAAGQLAVACVPFVWKAHLLARLGPLSSEESDRIVEEALADIFRGLGVKVRELGLPTIALIHGKWRGSKLNEEQPNRPLGMEIPVENIGTIGADFNCVGHIHLAQATSYNLAPICTPSSPYYVDYGESRHEKGYLLVEFDTDIVAAEPGSQVRWQRVSTPVAPMILLEYKWSKEMFVRVSDGEQFHESHIDAEGADLRFRYHYPKESSVQAKSAAGEVEATLLAQGAVKVKLDPVPVPTESARSLEIVKAATLTEQARLLWKKWNLKLTEPEERTLIQRIEEIQAECGFGQRLTLDAGIHVKSTRMKGFRCFPGEVSVDFNAIDGEVVAVSGPNGTGKSLFWELAVMGALYRDVPTHGKIGDHAIARDTFVETNFEYAGKDYTVSQIIDGKDNTGSTSLKIGETPVFGTETALRTQYDKWAADNLPPLSLVTSTTFMPQESKGILGMGATARKSLILKAKGVERYEVLAEAARKRATAVSKELEGARARLEEIGGVDVAAARSAVENFDTKMAHSMLDVCVIELEEARTKAAKIDRERVEYNALVVRRDELAGQVTALRSKRDGVLTRIEVGKELTGQKEAIEKAVAEVTRLGAEIDAKPTKALTDDLAKETRDHERLTAELATLTRRIEDLAARETTLSQRLAEIQVRMDEARGTEAEAETIRKAVEETAELQLNLKNKRGEEAAQAVKAVELSSKLNEVRARQNGNNQRSSELTRTRNEALIAVEAKADVLQSVAAVENRNKDIGIATEEIERYRKEVKHLQALMSSASSNENKTLRTGHEDIISGVDPIPRAERAIEEANYISEEASETPARLIIVEGLLAASEEALSQYQRSLQGHQAEAARLPYIEAAEATLAETTALLAEAQAEYETLTAEGNAIIVKQVELEKEQEQTQADIRWLNEQIEGLAPLVGRAEMLATAKARLQGLAEQSGTLIIDRNSIQAEIVSAKHDADELKMVIDDCALRVEAADIKLKACQEEVSILEGKIQEFRALANKAPLLAVAEAAEEQLLHQLSGIDKELEEAEHKHDGVESQVDGFTLQHPIDLMAYEKAVTDARSALSLVETQLAVAEKELKDAEAKEGRRQELASQVKNFEKEVDRWNLVERTCGRDGLIAESVAAAGDEINERANELLRASGNTKYTIDLKTTRLSKDGKKEIEGCPIYVHNSETGERQEGSTLSPGQRAFVNLPISLTLAEIGCKDSGVKPTIFMDEPTAGLDPIMRVQYMGMMRDVAQKTGAKIFCVTHNLELMELADANMGISDGKITVR